MKAKINLSEILITNSLSLLVDKVKYEVQYLDYKENQFTAPVVLTASRADGILSDNSIRLVRFTPIFGGLGNFSFEHKYLTP